MAWILSESLSIERLKIAIADLPRSLAGTKIVQLSDLHYDGESLTDEFLAKTIRIANEENPDLVILTGDYITDDPSPIDELVLRLKYLKSNKGIYACLGNHDIEYPNAKQKVTKALTRVGIKVLWNEIAYPLGEELPFVGLADYWSRQFSPYHTLSQLDPALPRIVLSHNPDTAEILQKWRVDLQLSGHTHGGQVTIPGYGPGPVLIQDLRRNTPKILRNFIPYLKECSEVMKHWEWAEGLHQVGDNLLYVNRGLGTYAPGRFFCPPELTVITLEVKN
ncbi:MAG: metallophosphoesterase [Prochloraceae cyanobacterium]